MPLQEEMSRALAKYIKKKDFQRAIGITENAEIEFLAQGEYNLNYLLKDGEDKFVIRLNLGSQMDLDDQIGYEFYALEQLAPSGVTPRPYYLDNSEEELPYGMLVMEYLPGRPLDYQRDLKKAAEVLAGVHEVEIAQNSILIEEKQPLNAIWDECDSLLDKYFKSELADPQVKEFLQKLKMDLKEKRKKEADIIELLPLSIVNTELNSANFLIDDKNDKAYLVDWEKPLITTPLQDLSIFMVPTTTLWKTNFIFNQGEKEEFLHHYLKARGLDAYYQEISSALELFNKFSAMRGISWSAMAWVEYQEPGRLIKNEDTFKTMDSYLKIDFLEMLFPQITL
ncbi:aminoglycoside phosphotransferase family protein [Halanaerobium sp. Z-7514]|uniref:Aminoglycoside phosphotransferase family protein n=1 Tax=Halanaerobium polyolivorans TaxID=2886943 RepID=A0AAW4WX42_9FIRM|nr:aminoglycoside phosphotransferase family protein [Halanaerobium polyolivorans]MCC3144363.1 aminoglycoside phosphotransferase family protein [Halanaerobium polyolivorans]